MNSLKWNVSKYTASFPNSSSGLLLYNSLHGAIARVPDNLRHHVESCLKEGFTGMPEGLLADLCHSGFFIPDSTDEMTLAHDLHMHQHTTNTDLDLIILPTGQCNFRCLYCYESFTQSEMTTATADNILRLVDSLSGDLSNLRVGWFGGEPLVALETIMYLLQGFEEICSASGTTLKGGMSTNGYLLSESTAVRLLEKNMRRFQVTLDGPPDLHDSLRCLANGKGTYACILKNLKQIRGINEPFRIVIRVNFHNESYHRIPELISSLADEFAGDGRFTMDFHPIGEWKGSSRTGLPTCTFTDGSDLKLSLHETAVNAGFDSYPLLSRLQPFGSVCYAANPRSIVISPAGSIHKCTVAFDDPRNTLGNIARLKRLPLGPSELNSWVHSGEEVDETCRECFFRPVCQGNSCPYARIKSGERACPLKTGQLQRIVEIVASDLLRNFTLNTGAATTLPYKTDKLTSTEAVSHFLSQSGNTL